METNNRNFSSKGDKQFEIEDMSEESVMNLYNGIMQSVKVIETLKDKTDSDLADLLIEHVQNTIPGFSSKYDLLEVVISRLKGCYQCSHYAEDGSIEFCENCGGFETTGEIDLFSKAKFLEFYEDFRNGLTLVVAKDHYEGIVAESEVLRDLLQSLRELDLDDVADTAISNLAEKGFELPEENAKNIECDSLEDELIEREE